MSTIFLIVTCNIINLTKLALVCFNEAEVNNMASRGLVVLDKNVISLKNKLQARNILVINMIDQLIWTSELKSSLLSGRIIVTDKSDDFIKDASSYDIGIIALDEIWGGVHLYEDEIARIVSDVLVGLWSKRSGWVLIIKEDGRHILKDLVD